MKKLAIAVLAACAMFVFMAENARAHDDEHHTPAPPPTPAAQAAAVPRDNWGGAPAHVAVSALAGVVCATHIYPKQSLKAFGCAMVPGVLKEIVDSQSKGNHFSQRDIVSDAVGAAIGVYTGGLMLTYSEHTKTTTVAISIPLQ